MSGLFDFGVWCIVVLSGLGFLSLLFCVIGVVQILVVFGLLRSGSWVCRGFGFRGLVVLLFVLVLVWCCSWFWFGCWWVLRVGVLGAAGCCGLSDF